MEIRKLARYILIHGAWSGSWVWEKVVPMLQKRGHEVEAIDLPKYGDVFNEDITLQTYVDKVCENIDHIPESVILVGHSMAGAVITQVAELRPKKVKSLVYVAAFLIRNNESISNISDKDTTSLVSESLVPFPNEGYGVIKPELAEDTFYGNCTKEDAEMAKSRMVKQPLSPLNAPVQTTAENFGSVPRYYIECLQDKTITIEYQQMMYTNLPCEKVFTLDTDHSPFLSKPKELTSILDSIS